jgi:hypothetical protein
MSPCFKCDDDVCHGYWNPDKYGIYMCERCQDEMNVDSDGDCSRKIGDSDSDDDPHQHLATLIWGFTENRQKHSVMKDYDPCMFFINMLLRLSKDRGLYCNNGITVIT